MTKMPCHISDEKVYNKDPAMDRRDSAFAEIRAYSYKWLGKDAKKLRDSFKVYDQAILRIIIGYWHDDAAIGKAMKQLLEECWQEIE